MLHYFVYLPRASRDDSVHHVFPRPAKPTAPRENKKTQILLAFFEIYPHADYQNLTKHPHVTLILSVERSETARPEGQYARKRHAAPHPPAALPPSELPPFGGFRAHALSLTYEHSHDRTAHRGIDHLRIASTGLKA